VNAAAKVYSVKRKTLSLQLNGIQSQRDMIPHNQKLTVSEESVIINYVLDLNLRGFSVRICVVGEMANLLLDQRQGAYVGKNWITNFINRRPEIKSIFNHKHDYKRLLCQDPEVISEWFHRVSYAIAKYGIQEGDIHNFNESGFLMGMIATAKVVTGAESCNQLKVAQPGNHEWVTIIQGVSSQGRVIPPFIILSGQYHLSSWYTDDELPPDWVIAISKNGWTINELGFAWLKHFDKHIKPYSARAY